MTSVTVNYEVLLDKITRLLGEIEFLEGERMTKESFMKSFDIAMEVARGMIEEGRELCERAERERDQAEYDRDYYARELEKERVLKSHLENVNEYYQTQIWEKLHFRRREKPRL